MSEQPMEKWEEARAKVEAEFNRPEMLAALAADLARVRAGDVRDELGMLVAVAPQPEEYAPTVSRETLERWARQDAEAHHSKGDPHCTMGNLVYDAAYRQRREELENAPVTAASIISADDIIERLLALPGEIAECERKLIHREDGVLAAKTVLLEEEYALLTGDDAPDGKNAETRTAQAKMALAAYYGTLETHENAVKWARRDLNLKLHEFSAVRAVARLLEREG